MNKSGIILLSGGVLLFVFLVLTRVGHNGKADIKTKNFKQVSIEEKIGTMLMVGFRGMSIKESSHIRRDIERYHLGGVILFDYDVPRKSPGRNISSPEQLKLLTKSLQQLTEHQLLIGIDQEGGRVARLKPIHGFLPHVSARYVGEIDNIDSTEKYAEQSARQLYRLGINVNFAPVLDLNLNPQNPVIGSLERSFSADPDVVLRHASIFIETFKQNQVIPVAKHFPGHGSSEDDSHLGVVDVTHTWQRVELEPYRYLISQQKLPMIMTAHIFNAHLDSLWPATLSPKIIQGLLRRDMGFSGVVISDDLQMEAIRAEFTLEETIRQSLEAGVDILLFANNSIYDTDIVPKTVEIIKKLIDTGKVSHERINTSYRRIRKNTFINK